MIGRLLCFFGFHPWDYSGVAYTHAPAAVRCTRCGWIR